MQDIVTTIVFLHTLPIFHHLSHVDTIFVQDSITIFQVRLFHL